SQSRRGKNRHGMQQRPEPRAMRLHLRTLLPKGNLLRMHCLSLEDERVAGVLLFQRRRGHL
ncbi:MAG: GNAT family N-acetyltransferase, partial [Deltaproteobacteria bacterium]|nr:GNAT family N-acetyltransferase [Deltaproteobacteria bacterium]